MILYYSVVYRRWDQLVELPEFSTPTSSYHFPSTSL